jgi:large subunit ribosomal protein L25
LLIKALPKDMPEEILVDISKLRLGGSVKVGELETGEFEILTSELVSVISVETPRTIRVVETEDEEEELEGEEGAEEGEEGSESGEGGDSGDTEGKDES